MYSLLNYARITPHSKNRAAQKKASTCTRSNTYDERGSICSSMSGESEEWWFEVRPKGSVRKQPCPTDDFCSVSSDSSSTPDATPVGAKHSRQMWPRRSRPRQSGSSGPAKNAASDRRSRRSEEKFTVALDLSVEALAVAVSLGTQEVLVMLEAELLAASTSAFAGE